jgi:hypothetical protein
MVILPIDVGGWDFAGRRSEESGPIPVLLWTAIPGASFGGKLGREGTAQAGAGITLMESEWINVTASYLPGASLCGPVLEQD